MAARCLKGMFSVDEEEDVLNVFFKRRVDLSQVDVFERTLYYSTINRYTPLKVRVFCRPKLKLLYCCRITKALLGAHLEHLMVGIPA